MLAARHRARLAMQDDNGDVREGFTRRNLRNENVRRRLFVDEDEHEAQESRRGRDENRTNVFFEEARKNLEQAKERWNFDFETETPLPGKYVWVKLDKDGKELQIPSHEKPKTGVNETASDNETCELTRSQTNGNVDRN